MSIWMALASVEAAYQLLVDVDMGSGFAAVSTLVLKFILGDIELDRKVSNGSIFRRGRRGALLFRARHQGMKALIKRLKR